AVPARRKRGESLAMDGVLGFFRGDYVRFRTSRDPVAVGGGSWLFQEGVAMSTAPSRPASVSVNLLPASARYLLWDVGEARRRRVARAAVEQASEHPAHPLSCQPAVLPHTSRRLSARRAVPLQQRVAASINHHPEAT
ncbi:hypothetical protein M3O60_20485, partial [Xanthomonas nasturtii]|nr:hypothetical protein [Xanthomonas nasturtii]